MRARAAAACAAAGVIIGCAGCTSGPAHSQASQGHTGATTSAPLALPDRTPLSPGCSTVIAKSPLLSGVGTAMVSVPASPFGVAVTADGRWAFVAWLYATSEATPRTMRSNQGTLTVMNLARAETDPAGSVVATVPAGCNPVRVITSADGREVWVTARASDDLLCFSAAELRSDPARALVAIVRVGEAPVGLMLVRNGSLVVVADSNRFGAPGASSDLSVVNVAAALAGRPAVVGHIPAGQFPREMALEPDGQRLLVTNFGSGQLEAVSIPSIP
jgi:DNA-binding beta-propeller fold protein YncE